VVLLILITPTLSMGWGPGGHMMTASIAYDRLTTLARGKVDELLAIDIPPGNEAALSRDFVNASHWADDLRDYDEFNFLDPFHYINIPFTTDGTPLPADLPKPDNILKALKDNLRILRTSPDKRKQAQALRLIIHFVGDIHQPLHNVARVTQAHRDGDQGGNLFSIKIRQPNGTFRPVKLHSYWDGGIDTFPKGGPPPDWDPPPLSAIPPAVAIALEGNPDNNPLLNESSDLAKSVSYKDISEGGEPSETYKKKSTSVVRTRVAWGGYRLAALLNAIWP